MDGDPFIGRRPAPHEGCFPRYHGVRRPAATRVQVADTIGLQTKEFYSRILGIGDLAKSFDEATEIVVQPFENPGVQRGVGHIGALDGQARIVDSCVLGRGHAGTENVE